MFMFNKNKLLKESIREFTTQIISIDSLFSELITVDKLNVSLEENSLRKEIPKLESLIDIKLHKIENQLYTDSLLPEFREDLFSLLEEIDNIADIYEDMANFFYKYNIEYPLLINSETMKVREYNSMLVALVAESMNTLFDKNSVELLHPNIDAIIKYESQVDEIEQKMIRDIFSSDLSDMHKMLYRDYILLLTSISDTCENVADIMKVILIKRVI